jgi:hypothetical protein
MYASSKLVRVEKGSERDILFASEGRGWNSFLGIVLLKVWK